MASVAATYMINPEVIRIATDRKRELLGNLVENLDFTDSTGIISSEGSILKRCELMQIMYVFLGDPEFVLEYGFSKDQVEKGERFEFDSKYRDSIRNRAIAAAAETLNISPEAFEDPSKFTPEMQSAFNAALDGITANRVSCYLFCFYNLALSAIHHYNVRMKKPPESAKTGVDLRQAAVSYFFALNPQVNPFTVIHEGETFSEDFSKGVIEIYEKICEFYYSHDKIDSTRKLLRSFLKEVATKAPLPCLGHAETLAPIFSSDTTLALAYTRTIGKMNSLATALEVGNVQITSTKINELGIGGDKLFRYALSLFASVNHKFEKKPSLRVYGDTRDFARACKIAIDPEKKDSPEEQKKENERAKKALTNFVMKLKRDAENLKSSVSYSFTHSIGSKKKYSGLSFISYYEIDSDSIMIEFSQKGAEYLVTLPIGYTPRILYEIDEKRKNAYAIASKMLQHYSMENNVLRDSERSLQMKSLLEVTTYSIDKCIENHWSWNYQIKDKFESDLAYLYSIGFFEREQYDNGKRVSGGYSYCGAGKKEISDAQFSAGYYSSFEQYASSYLHFELANFPSHADRERTIRERNKLNGQKPKSKKSRKKKRSQESTSTGEKV